MSRSWSGVDPVQDGLYASYLDFKKWEGKANADRYFEFSAMMNLAIPGRGGLRIIELGIGEGEFLKWASDAGHDVYGTEIIPELCERAVGKGFKVACEGRVDNVFSGVRFDVCVAIDLLEHLSTSEAICLLRDVSSRLVPGGCLIARFPNGNSPFSLRFQNGDATHKQFLSPEKVIQMAAGSGLKAVFVGNLRQGSGSIPGNIRRAIVYGVRDLVEIVIGYLYYGYRLPLDPNCVIVLRLESEVETGT